MSRPVCGPPSMASLAAPTLLLFLLALASLHAVSNARQCYQSTCLPHDLFGCYSDQRASLTTCSFQDFSATAQQLSADLLPANHTADASMMCVSIQASGELEHRVHTVVIKMCFPDTPFPCRALEQYTRQQMAALDVQEASIAFACTACDADGCNSAGRPAPAALLALLVALAAASALVGAVAARE